jgi:hypothetical protein
MLMQLIRKLHMMITHQHKLLQLQHPHPHQLTLLLQHLHPHRLKRRQHLLMQHQLLLLLTRMSLTQFQLSLKSVSV